MVVSNDPPETTELSYSKSLKESGASMAARALRLFSLLLNKSFVIEVICFSREFTKSSPTALQLDTMPPETLFSDDCDFSRWTMIVDDKSLKVLSEQVSLLF